MARSFLRFSRAWRRRAPRISNAYAVSRSTASSNSDGMRRSTHPSQRVTAEACRPVADGRVSGAAVRLVLVARRVHLQADGREEPDDLVGDTLGRGGDGIADDELHVRVSPIG